MQWFLDFCSCILIPVICLLCLNWWKTFFLPFLEIIFLRLPKSGLSQKKNHNSRNNMFLFMGFLSPLSYISLPKSLISESRMSPWENQFGIGIWNTMQRTSPRFWKRVYFYVVSSVHVSPFLVITVHTELLHRGKCLSKMQGKRVARVLFYWFIVQNVMVLISPKTNFKIPTSYIPQFNLPLYLGS